MSNLSTILDHAIAALATVCAALVLMSPVACTVHRDRAIADAIKNGVDPIAARCAIGGPDASHAPMCVGHVSTRQK